MKVAKHFPSAGPSYVTNETPRECYVLIRTMYLPVTSATFKYFLTLHRTSRNSFGRLYPLFDTAFAKRNTITETRVSLLFFHSLLLSSSFSLSLSPPSSPWEKCFHADVYAHIHTRACTREETIGQKINQYQLVSTCPGIAVPPTRLSSVRDLAF